MFSDVYDYSTFSTYRYSGNASGSANVSNLANKVMLGSVSVGQAGGLSGTYLLQFPRVRLIAFIGGVEYDILEIPPHDDVRDVRPMFWKLGIVLPKASSSDYLRVAREYASSEQTPASIRINLWWRVT